MENFLFEKCILRYFKHEPTTDQKSGINKLKIYFLQQEKSWFSYVTSGTGKQL